MSEALFVNVERKPQAIDLWTGLTHRWTAAGKTFELSNWRTGIFLGKGGVEGLGTPPQIRHISEAPGRPGTRYRGQRELERPVFWPIHIYSDISSEHWLSLDREFWDTMDPQITGVWSVQAPGRKPRYLNCRFINDGGQAYEVDPSSLGWAVYGVSLVAEDPYWYEDLITKSFYMGVDEVDFIPVGGAPDFHITAGASLTNSEVTNPGDVEAWPVWTIRGPGSNISIIVDGAELALIPALAANDVVVIDTWRQTVMKNGVRVRGLLSKYDFAPIPPKGTSALDLTALGTGYIDVAFFPKYRRAW